MKLGFALTALAFTLGSPLVAQMKDNHDRNLKCQQGQFGRSRESVCEVREATVSGNGRFAIEGVRNGSITVLGWERKDVLVRTSVTAWADTEAEAKTLMGEVRTDTTPGRLEITGPDPEWWGGRQWSVSTEIFVPHETGLDLSTRNGAIRVSDVAGQMMVETRNGALSLSRVGGRIQGETRNGKISLALLPGSVSRQPVDLSTRNGAVEVSLPEKQSAHVELETRNGSLSSDFPTPSASLASSRARQRSMSFDIGGGGPVIRVETRNGGVRLRRL